MKITKLTVEILGRSTMKHINLAGKYSNLSSLVTIRPRKDKFKNTSQYFFEYTYYKFI